MLSLHLKEWLEWKGKSVAQSVGFCTGLWRVCGLLLRRFSCLERISLEWSVQK